MKKLPLWCYAGFLFFSALLGLRLCIQGAVNLPSWPIPAPERDVTSILAVMSAVTLIWSAVYVCLSRKLAFHGSETFFALAGWGQFTLLSADALGVHASSVCTRIVLLAPCGLLLLACARLPLLRAPSRPMPKRLNPIIIGAAIIVAGAIVLRALDAVPYLALVKDAPEADEKHIWFYEVIRLLQTGLGQYRFSHKMWHYDPGYAFMGTTWLGILPGKLHSAGMMVIPLLWGISLAWILWESFAERGRWLILPGTIFVGLCLYHSWVYWLFFRMWYGEAMGVAVTACLFALLDASRALSTKRLFLCFGIGITCVLSKPPLSFLIVPLFLPAYIATQYLAASKIEKWSFIVPPLTALAGALVGKLAWKLFLQGSDVTYDFSLYDFLHPDFFTGSFAALVPYFFRNYYMYWISYVLLAASALAVNPKRYLPSLVMATGMILSIFALYACIWKGVEHESGARYIMHGLMGWILFAAGRVWQDINNQYQLFKS